MPTYQNCIISNQLFNTLSNAQKLMLSGVQGLANRGHNRMYCQCNNFNDLKYEPLSSEYIQKLIKFIGVYPKTFQDALDLYTEFNTYILCDITGNPTSMNIATTMAGLMNALPVDVSLVSQLPPGRYSQALDVRSWDYDTFLTNIKGKYNPNFVVELDPAQSWAIRDLAICNKAIVLYDAEQRGKVMKMLPSPLPLFGWGPVDNQGEYKFILNASQHGNYFVAANHAFNLSVLSHLRVPASIVPARNATTASIAPQPNTTYVAFMMSDGDNLQWLLNRANSKHWWKSPVRGTIPMGWTFSPSLASMAPIVWNDYMSSLTALDEVICGPCGIGYVFEDIINSDASQAFMDRSHQAMQRLGMKYVSAFGNGSVNTTYLGQLLNSDHVNGVIYTSYIPWVTPPHMPNPIPVNGKWAIPTNINMNGKQTQDIINSIRHNANHPSLIMIYLDAWNSEQYNPLDTAKEVYDALVTDGRIKFVKPSQLFTLAAKTATPRHRQFRGRRG